MSEERENIVTMSEEEEVMVERVTFSKERLETLLFNERRTRRGVVRRRRALLLKRKDVDEKLATAEGEIADHNRRVDIFKEELRRATSPV